MDHRAQNRATQAEQPPMKASNESTKEQLRLAKEQGDALQKALEAMGKQDVHGSKEAGDYLVDYAIEEAEGMYHMRDGKLEWREPQDENLHVEICVRDGADRRFIPALSVRVTLVDPNGKEVGTHEQPFLWHPWLYHYGRNWQVPAEGGGYTMRVHIDPPTFPRHDKKNGQRYTEPVEVVFTGVKVETGQKKS